MEISEQKYNITLKNIKKKEKRAMIIALISSIVPLILGIIWIWFTYNKVSQFNYKVDQLTNESRILTKQIEEKQNVLDSITKLRDEIQLEYLEAKGFNYEKNGSQLKNAINADAKLKLLQERGKIDKEVRIQYYRKTLDQDKVWLSIKELGYIHIGDIQSRAQMNDIETNCLAFGKDVPLYDLKLVLLTLIRAGIEVQQVMPSEKQIDKTKLIQIVGVKYASGADFNKEPISIEDILKANTTIGLIW